MQSSPLRNLISQVGFIQNSGLFANQMLGVIDYSLLTDLDPHWFYR